MSLSILSLGLRVVNYAFKSHQARYILPRLFARVCSTKSCLRMGTKDQLFNLIAEPCHINSDKVTVVGTGDVGMATAFSLLAQGISSDVAIIDMNQKKMKGELLDLQHGCSFLNAKISATTDYSCTKGSKVCIITAGARQKEGESRLALVQRNTDILKAIIPNLLKHSPDAILLIVTNPCDIMAWVAWKISGLPKNRVMASGTSLDTSRFKFFLSKKFGVSPDSVHGWIIGEHGDSSVAVWSGVNVCGVRLKDISPNIGLPNDPENWGNLHDEVIKAAYNVIKLKGFTNWAIGLSSAAIVKNILRNSNNIQSVGTYLKGVHGIEQEVFLSVPVVLSENGISSLVIQKLLKEEHCALLKSAAIMSETQSGIKI